MEVPEGRLHVCGLSAAPVGTLEGKKLKNMIDDFKSRSRAHLWPAPMPIVG